MHILIAIEKWCTTSPKNDSGQDKIQQDLTGLREETNEKHVGLHVSQNLWKT